MNLRLLADRDRALKVACPGPPRGCSARPGQECASLADGRPLVHQAAHYARLVLAGVTPGRTWLGDVSRETTPDERSA